MNKSVYGLRDAQRATEGAVITAALIGLVVSCAGVVRAEPGDNHLISIDLTSGLAAGNSTQTVVLSRDGRYVAFDSYSARLVAGDSNGSADVFVHDRASGTTERASVGMGGMESAGTSFRPTISSDGRFVAFSSSADNLAPGDDDQQVDVFVRDRVEGVTREVSIAPDGAGLPCWAILGGISDDGRYVAFACDGGVFLRDMVARTTKQLVAIGPPPALWSTIRISGNGRFVLYDDYRLGSVCVYDRITATTAQLVRGPSHSPSLSRDGRWVAYSSPSAEVPDDTNGIADVFLLDRWTGLKRRVSVSATGRQTDSSSWPLSVSDDGRYVAFASFDGQLVPGVPDDEKLLIKDMQTGAVEFVAITHDLASLSGDGRLLGFDTNQSLVPADLNDGSSDTYVHEVGRSSDVPAVYIYNLRPRSIDYGEVRISSLLRRGFRIVNVGSSTLPVTTVEIVGTNRTQFSMRNYCPIALPPAEACWIAVSFVPTNAGEKRARLHVVAGGIERSRLVQGIATQ